MGRRRGVEWAPRSPLCLTEGGLHTRESSQRRPRSGAARLHGLLALPNQLASRTFAACSPLTIAPHPTKWTEPPPTRPTANPSPAPRACRLSGPADLLARSPQIAVMRQSSPERLAWPPALRPLAAAAAVAALAVLLLIGPPLAARAAAAPAAPQQISHALLHKLLYEEPNAQLQALGNVRLEEYTHVVVCPAARLAFAFSSRHLHSAALARSPWHDSPNCHRLLQLSDHEGSLSRIFLSPAHRRAAGQVWALTQPLLWLLASGCCMDQADSSQHKLPSGLLKIMPLLTF